MYLGRASGTMATMSMLGALVGFGLFGTVVQTGHAYLVYCVVIIVAVSITCLVAREKPSRKSAPYSCSELLSSYSINVEANPDFFWVFVTRTFYYMCISLQAFVLFMLRDVQQVCIRAHPYAHTHMRTCICAHVVGMRMYAQR